MQCNESILHDTKYFHLCVIMYNGNYIPAFPIADESWNTLLGTSTFAIEKDRTAYSMSSKTGDRKKRAMYHNM